MTRTPDEIKNGLECCAASYADCHKECPYKLDCDGSQILKDALALIQQLEAQNAELSGKIGQLQSTMGQVEKTLQDNGLQTLDELLQSYNQVKMERDAAVKDMHEVQACLCLICKNYKRDQYGIEIGCKVFGDFPYEDSPIICGQFGWRGVQKEGSGDGQE